MPDLREVLELCALGGAMAVAAWVGRQRWVGVAILGLLSVVWLCADFRWEGPVLVSFTEHHGLVAGDLPGVTAGLVAVWLAIRRVRARTPSPPPTPARNVNTRDIP